MCHSVNDVKTYDCEEEHKLVFIQMFDAWEILGVWNPMNCWRLFGWEFMLEHFQKQPCEAGSENYFYPTLTLKAQKDNLIRKTQNSVDVLTKV